MSRRVACISAGIFNGGAWLHVGRLRLRWVDREFRPLFSERYGYKPWRKAGRFGWRWERML